MEMMILTPVAPAAPANGASQPGAASQAIAEKSSATGFSDILGSAIKATGTSIEKDPKVNAKDADGLMQTMATAMYGIFQPVAVVLQQTPTDADGNTGLVTDTTGTMSLPTLRLSNAMNKTALLTGADMAAQQREGSILLSDLTADVQAENKNGAGVVTSNRTKLPGEMLLASSGLTKLSETSVSQSSIGVSNVIAGTGMMSNQTDKNLKPAVNNNTMASVNPVSAHSQRQKESNVLGIPVLQHTVISQELSKGQEVSAGTNATAMPEKPLDLIDNASADKNNDGEWQSGNFEQRTGQLQNLLAQQNGSDEAKQDIFSFQTVIGGQTSVRSVEAPDTQSLKTMPVADKYEVISQIIEHARMITRPNNSEMIIKLKPEHLGELTLKVTVEQGVMNASFHSNNPEVRGIIEASLPQLKQDLNNQGIKLDNVGVFAGMDQFLSGDHRGGQYQQQGEVVIQRKNPAEFDEAIDLTAVTNPEVTTGVDYRV